MILEKIVRQKKVMLAKIIEEYNQKYSHLITGAGPQRRTKTSFYDAISKPGLSIIGEIKKASPSKGIIKDDFKPLEIAKEYENHVEAISVLTEETFFMGKLDYLHEVSQGVRLPVLCKDFIIDPVQIQMAHVLGASAVLLIASILSKDQLQEYLLYGRSLGMDALVEVHTEEELDKVLETDAKIIGINNRNLKDFTTDLNTTISLGKTIEKNHLIVSESGIYSGKDISFISMQTRVDAVLVGESFMRSPNIPSHAKELKDGYKSKN